MVWTTAYVNLGTQPSMKQEDKTACEQNFSPPQFIYRTPDLSLSVVVFIQRLEKSLRGTVISGLKGWNWSLDIYERTRSLQNAK